jgi:hypothetical protein
MPVAAPPYGQAPPTWSNGQWSPPLQSIEPPHYTPRPLGMGMRRPRRWGLRFIMFFGLVGLGAFLGRDHLPRFPRSLAEASTTWDALNTSVRRAAGSLTGKSVPPKTEPAPAAHAARGPQIVPMPSPGGAPAAPPPAATVALSPHPTAPPAAAAPEPAPRPARVMTAPRPVRLAAVSRPHAKKSNDPFESDDAAAVALGKSLKTPAAVAAREAPAREAPPPREAPARAERPAPEPKAAPGSLEDLMSTSLKHPAKAGRELDRRLAGVGESRDTDPPRKKAEVEAPAVHALSRAEIQTAMGGLKGKMHDCSQQFQQTGPADVKVTVGESGSVTAVVLSGQFAGTPTGACVEKAVKGVSFPQSGGLRFDYRLSLR